MVVNHYWGGAFYPRGGASQIARCIVPLITRAGGAVLVRAPVSKILLRGGKAAGVEVRGNEVFAPLVISACGATNTFKYLLSKEEVAAHAPEVYKSMGLEMTADQTTAGPAAEDGPSVYPSCSMVSVFVGLNGSQEELNLPKHNIWSFASWDHEANMRGYHNSLPGLSDESKKGCLVAPAYFVSFPSAKERTWDERWPGKSVALILTPADYATFAPFADKRVKHRGEEYESIKKEYEVVLMKELKRLLPNLEKEGRIDYIDVGSPVTNNFYLGTHDGEVYGVSPSAKRWSERWLRPDTPIPGLYLCGQDALSMGVAGALTSGFFTVASMDKQFLWENLHLLL
jgi:all-trans-retinol 13,14-reductase